MTSEQPRKGDAKGCLRGASYVEAGSSDIPKGPRTKQGERKRDHPSSKHSPKSGKSKGPMPDVFNCKKGVCSLGLSQDEKIHVLPGRWWLSG